MQGANHHPTLEDAVALAASAHKGQLDRGGQPYLLHPLRVMLRLHEEVDRIVAVLHDVVEDTSITLDDLRAAGYSEEICTAVDAVTKRPGEPYEDYVNRAALHPIGRRVKLADLDDNMHRRLPHPPSESDLARLAKYRAAWDRLHENT
jgi:(p)ppGpp synthase/HD superfamily hydrolase